MATVLEPESGDMVNSATRKNIRKTVIITHVAVVVMPFLVLMVYQWFTPKPPERIRVRLVQIPPVDNSGKRSIAPRPKTQKAKAKPKPKKKAIKKAKLKTKKKIIKKKPSKAKPKKKVIKKPVKKSRPKRKILRANDIKISRNVVKNKTPKKLSPADLEKKILKNWKKVNYPVKATTQYKGRVTAAYSDTVGAYLEPIWDQPNKVSLGGRLPEVTIRLNIAANGRVTGRKIMRRSGIAAMDRSIEKLLKNLTYVPAPSDRRAKSITIIMAIEK